MAKILLVDDEKDIVEFLQYNLENEGFEVVSAHDGEMALQKVHTEDPDLIVLDVMMPKMNGYDVCKNIRMNDEFKNIPIIFLTAKTSEFDELKGFDLGADDYIKKPISPKMLVARVKSKLMRAINFENNVGNSSKIVIGPIEINLEKYEVKVDGESIVFPRKEFAMLAYLAKKPGKVFPRDRMLNDIWGEDIYVIERTVDVHIRKIREKLGKHSKLIETIKGVGYRFKEL